MLASFSPVFYPTNPGRPGFYTPQLREAPDLVLVVLFMLVCSRNYVQAVILSIFRVNLFYFPSLMDPSSALPVVQCLKSIVLYI